MKRTVLGVTLLLCLGASSAFAEPCERGFQLKTVGQTSEDTQTLLASGGVEVRAIWFTSTSSAGLATLNDSADTGGTTALGTGTVKIEVGSAASTTAVIPSTGFFDPPMYFKNGVVSVGNGNVQGVGVMACVPGTQ